MAVSAWSKRAPTGGGVSRERFVPWLEEELGALRDDVAAVLEQPADFAACERLATRLRRLGAGVNSIGEEAVALELSGAEAVAVDISASGSLGEASRRTLLRAIEALVSLAQAIDEAEEESSGPAPAVLDEAAPCADATQVRIAAIGAAALAETLSARLAGATPLPVVSHLPRPETAATHLRSARPVPDVIVIDADLLGAELLAEELLSEAPTDEIPLVVVGSFATPEQAARYVALGAARCFSKPVSAAELREACAALRPEPLRGAAMPVGATTIAGLEERLVRELEAGLGEALDGSARNKPLDLGDGSEVLTVMWDAVARIRELVTAHTNGSVRFRHDHRVEALPVGASVTPHSRREEDDRLGLRGEVRSIARDALTGITALVAEEDLSTNWFLAGVLREAGATVFDAFTGTEALDQAVRRVPDVVLAGVSLPGLDGARLARALENDVMLRDTPIVLVASERETLRRVRELGVTPDGTLYKGASGKAVLRRVLEVLRPHQGLAARLATRANVQGRLDGLSPISLLRLVARSRPDARIFVQTGHQAFEIDVCGGTPVRAHRTAVDGAVTSGREALAELFGVFDGRFRIEWPSSPVEFELAGTLDELLAESTARVRAAQRLTSGAWLMRAERVELAPRHVTPLFAATPEPHKSALAALLDGASPRQLVGSARFAPDVVESVLSDAARRLAVSAVYDVSGAERLEAATSRELSRVQGKPVACDEPPHATCDAGELALPAPWQDDSPAQRERAIELDAFVALRDTGDFESPLSAAVLFTDDPSPSEETAGDAGPLGIEASTVQGIEASPVQYIDALAESLADAEVAARTSVATPLLASLRPAPGAPATLAPSMGMPAKQAPITTESAVAMAASTGSAASTAPTAATAATAAHAEDEPDAALPPRASSRPATDGELLAMLSGDSLPEGPGLARAIRKPAILPALRGNPWPSRNAPLASATCVAGAAAPSPAPKANHVLPAASAEPTAPAQPEPPATPKVAMPSSFATKAAAPVAAPPGARASRMLAPVFFAVVGLGLAFGARWWRFEQPAAAPGAAPGAALADATLEPVEGPAAAQLAPPAARDATASEAPAASGAEEAAMGSAPSEVALSDKELRAVGAGKGVIEVVAGKRDEIFVDGKSLGFGPSQRAVVAADGRRLDVRVKLRGEERVRYVIAKEGVRLRLRIAPPWSN